MANLAVSPGMLGWFCDQKHHSSNLVGQDGQSDWNDERVILFFVGSGQSIKVVRKRLKGLIETEERERHLRGKREWERKKWIGRTDTRAERARGRKEKNGKIGLTNRKRMREGGKEKRKEKRIKREIGWMRATKVEKDNEWLKDRERRSESSSEINKI